MSRRQILEVAVETAQAIESTLAHCAAHMPEGCPWCDVGGHDGTPERRYAAAVRYAEARLSEHYVDVGVSHEIAEAVAEDAR